MVISSVLITDLPSSRIDSSVVEFIVLIFIHMLCASILPVLLCAFGAILWTWRNEKSVPSIWCMGTIHEDWSSRILLWDGCISPRLSNHCRFVRLVPAQSTYYFYKNLEPCSNVPHNHQNMSPETSERRMDQNCPDLVHKLEGTIQPHHLTNGIH